MPHEPAIEYGESASQILETARSRGLAVTERQLKRWQAEGLMPRPKQVHRSGIAGSVTMYPEGSSRQLVALCIIAKAYRKSSDRGWYLWRLGQRVHEKHWRTTLEEAASILDKSKRFATSDEGVPTLADSTIDHTEKLAQKEFSHPLAGPIKQRLGSQDFAAFLNDLVLVLGGAFDLWDPEIGQINLSNIEGIGIHKAAFSGFVEFNPDEYAALLGQLAAKYPTIEFRKRLISISAEQLNYLCWEFSVATNLADAIVQVAHGAKGRSDPYMALAKVSKIQQALFLLGWSLIRDFPPIKSAMEQIIREQGAEIGEKLW